jgi:PAS domain S-box-containing protein
MVRRERDRVLKRRRRRSPAEAPVDAPVEPAAEHARADLALEQSLELALEAGGMGTWSWDPASGIARWSESMERLCGLEAGTFGGTAEDAIALVHPDERGVVSERVAASIAGDEPIGMRYRVVRPDGGVRWIDNRSRKLPDGTWVGVAIDITEQHQVEE